MDARRVINNMGYTSFVTGRTDEPEVLAKESDEIHFSAWLCEGKTLMDAEPEKIKKLEPITMALLKKGYELGTVKLEQSPQSDDVVCRIGDYWFYFGGYEAEGISTEEYRKVVPQDDILKEILASLEEIRDQISRTEYDYYSAVLHETVGKFVCYEEPFTGACFSKAEWLAWYDKNGTKDNFNSPEDWWSEMIRMGLLVPEDDKKETKMAPEEKSEEEQLISETVTQQCNACGKQFDVVYHSDGTYDYVDEGAVCGCDSDFSPVDGPSLAEWLENLKLRPVGECCRYLVFINSDFVLDAQAYFGDSLRDVSGDLLVLDRYAKSPQEIIEQMQKIYPGASAEIFTIVQIRTKPSEDAYCTIGLEDGADGKWKMAC